MKSIIYLLFIILFFTSCKPTATIITSKNDALKKGIADGIIDVIVSDHAPQDIESKDLEFDLADNGMIGLESCFGVLNTALNYKLSLENMIDMLTKNPRAILEIDSVSIKEGVKANLTLFTLHDKTTFTEKDNASKSKNSPFIGKTLNGRVVGVINNGKVVLN